MDSYQVVVTKMAARWQRDLGHQLRLFYRAHRDAVGFGYWNSALNKKERNKMIRTFFKKIGILCQSI